MKRITLISVITAMCFSFLVNAQEGSFPSSEPREIINRLSTVNFRNIKLLYPAIMNYGGGEEEFDRLVKTYSEASSLYFSREYEKAAKKFQENEKQIQEVATELARKYKEDTTTFQEDIINKNIKDKIKTEMTGDEYNESREMVITQSTAAIVQANEFFDRVRPIQAIEHYRLSRERMLQYLYLEAEQLPDETVEKCRENMRDYEVCVKKERAERRAQVRNQYEKLIQDVNNEVYFSKEKEN
ncbi:MAG: hypothetical protein ACOCWH_03800 [Spirochaetota bacterium]